MTEKEFALIMSYIENAVYDVMTMKINRQDIELENYTIKVYRVGKNYRIDIIPTGESV